MGARGRQPPRDPDDWFDEPDPIPPRRPRRPPEHVDPDARTREHTVVPSDWLAAEPLPRKRNSRRVDTRRLLLALAIAVALLLIGLAAGGVFSGGGSKKTNTPPTTQTTRTTTQTPMRTLAVPTATLKLGDHGTAVKELQRALSSLGYTVGTIDGVFGTSTEQALIAFQTANHLSPDGVLGPASAAALQNALRPG